MDPATNAVSAVVPVGGVPSATAVAAGGHSVWVFNAVGPSLTEIDVSTNTVLNTTTLLASPNNPTCRRGAVLVADRAGAWLIGTDSRGRPYLTRVFSGFRGKREYRLPGKPRAIAVGYGAVWVVVHGALDNQLLRINPDTGRVTKRIVSPAPRRSTVWPPALAVSGSGPRPLRPSTGSTLARHAWRTESTLAAVIPVDPRWCLARSGSAAAGQTKH